MLPGDGIPQLLRGREADFARCGNLYRLPCRGITAAAGGAFLHLELAKAYQVDFLSCFGGIDNACERRGHDSLGGTFIDIRRLSYMIDEFG